jgi:myosin-5
VVLSADGLSESTVKVDDTAIYDISHSLPLDDLSRYNNLHEAPLLMGLKSRFSSNNIYTHCGDVLLSINPYQDIPNLYTLDKTPETSPTDEDEDDDDDDDEANPPHVYTIAKQALNAIMVKDNKNQSIVISGESGAGKTEASKHVMRWLLNESSKLDSSTDASIQTRLMQSNVILEAFGNAKTVRNDNSSRFGKYIKMKYDSKNTIIGAKTDHFLLEKSRLVNVAKGERNYHIFYQMASGLPEEEKAKLNLLPAKSYKMLNQGKTLTVASVDDSAEFSETCEAMKTLGITVAEQKNLFEILSGLLQLGNVEFKPKADGSNGVEPSFKESEFSIKSVAGLLGVEMSEFVIRMTENRSISARGSITAIPLDERKASNNARALVKYVYGMLFEYIVDKINKSHATSEEQPADSFVGILDIFGFEIFKANSFEQLCINYANEKLQQQFNQVVFVLEKQAYEKEGIDSSVIKFEDNQPVIDLISKKPSGLFCMLEEHCLMSREPNNQALLHSFYSTHDKHESFSKPRFGDESFVVKHFAGSVEYLAANFIEKNNDSLTDELLDLTKFSKNELLATVMSDKEVEEGDEFDQLPDAPRESMGPRGSMMGQRRSTGKAGGRGLAALNTVSFVFRSQLEKLTEALRATTPHYIKCIKPNSVKAPGGFSNQLVIDQLRYSGVLEVVRIRREGFPTRMAYTEFHQKYEILLRGNKDAKPSAGASEEESRAATLLICQKALAEENYQLGKTCLFLRDMMLQELAQTVKDFYASKATMIISRFRVRLAVKKYKKAKASASQLEAFARMLRKKKQFKQEKALMTKIQAHVRGRLERVGYGKKLREETNAVTKIASARRMMLEHRDYLKTLESVKKIETVFRMHHQQQEFQDSKQKAIAVQAAFRGYQAQKDLSTKLVSAARLQICIRAFVANSRLDTKLIDLHAFARDNNSEKLKAMLAKEPELKDMRYRFDHFKTLLQTTCKAGHLGLAQILDPSFDEVLKKDGLGNSALHYAAGSGNIDLVKYLSSVVNAAAMLDAKDHKVGLKKALRRLRTKTSGAVELSERSDEVLMSGWLQKHKVGKKMDTRWCVLTRHELKYYKRKSDKIPTKTLSLEVAMVKHSVAADHTFEFLSPFLLDSKKNPHGRMDFTAESEVVLQKWLAALRVSDAMTEMLVQTATGAAVEKSYVSNSALRTFVRQLNNMGQTPLHVLASTKKSKFATIDSQGRLPSGSGARKRLSTAHYIRQETRLGGLTLSDIVRVVGVAAYLIEAGVDIDTKDKDGNTALRFAVVNKNLELATALVKKGADLSAKGADGQSALDLLNSTDVEELASVGNLAISGDLPPLKAAPPKVAGCSYLSFKVGKLCLMDLEDEENTYLKFTVHVRDPSGNCEVAEEPAAIPMPISESVEFLFWGGTFHLQSSLEDLKGAFAVLELCSRKEKNNTIAWCKLDLNVATINSGDVSLEMYSGDVDLKGDATEYEAADMVLNAEVVLTKKE